MLANQSLPTDLPRLEAVAPEHAARLGGDRAFRVVIGGRIADLDLACGELLVVVDGASIGDRVVLIPRRFGHPMLGRMERGGAVVEPGGFHVGARWSVAGRIVLRVRTAPSGPGVVSFPQLRCSEQVELSFGAGAQAQAGPAIQVRADVELDGELLSALGRRIPGLRRAGRYTAVADAVALFRDQPMDLGAAMVADLGRRLGISLVLVVADDVAQAQALVVGIRPPAVVVAEAAASRAWQTKASRQLGLFLSA